MNFENLGELNKIYNCQDTVILCEIFEQLSDQLQKLFIYNPRQCTSASYFSGCAQRHQSKCCIALPTDTEYVRIFEKTLIGGFSCVNTKLPFNTWVYLFPIKRMRRFCLIQKSMEKKKRVVMKILKMDRNNQYEAMTKAPPYGCIKNKKINPTRI